MALNNLNRRTFFGRRYSIMGMILVLLGCDMLRSARDLQSSLMISLRILFVPQVAEQLIDKMLSEKVTLPSMPTISRFRLVLDVTYMAW